MTLEKIEAARKNRSALYLVKDGSTIVGMLEKYRNTKTETHPWKAFYGWGLGAQFLGAFYEIDDIRCLQPASYAGTIGGKQAALQAIADRRLATGGKIPAGADYDVP